MSGTANGRDQATNPVATHLRFTAIGVLESKRAVGTLGPGRSDGEQAVGTDAGVAIAQRDHHRIRDAVVVGGMEHEEVVPRRVVLRE